MKKLLFLLAVTALLASVGGCRCLEGFCRGSAYPATTGAVCDPCAPTCAPVYAPNCAPACDACGGAPGGLMPSPTATYVPGPVN